MEVEIMSKRVKYTPTLDHKRQQSNQATPGKQDSEFASYTDTQATRMDKLQPGGESQSKYPRHE
ncbi:hypothetical protein HMPREF0083_02893 [Aneurinibacillus aneurinilyticus ATCC 12856]|jgi:hypothetical protein|uniref:Uncharacterized protein n=2 Tax=Aneurinibacillus aneurinilyticus TaxID=1391 RepID=U1YE03_ANEAE|nr:hypothetical protein HMPREF0083_02893 [Aneurinibacillus aneurinilyticus ATCC 12856]